MRLISWNMNRRKGSWDYLINELRPDIALLQETSPFDKEELSEKLVEVEVKKNLRNSIYSASYLFEKIKLPNDGGIGINATSIELNNFGKIYFISVYGNLDFWDTLDIHLIGVLCLYTQVLCSQYHAKHIVIAGDFNYDRQMDDNPTGTKFVKVGEKRANIFFDSLKNLGYVDCLEQFYPDYVQTHRHTRSEFPWQTSHMFMTNKLFNHLDSLEVLENPKVIQRSDHNPIIADLNIA